MIRKATTKQSLSLICILLAVAASAQSRRVVTYTTHTSTHRVTTQTYATENVDEEPRFPGGETELVNFINSNRHYPSDAYDAGVEGRVLCGFIVRANGEITDVDVLRGVCPSLDCEAVRLIKSMPRWKPGKLGNEKVATYYFLVIPFRR